MEAWKSLDGIFDCGEYYKVSNLGNVVSIDRKIGNRFIKGQDIKLSNDRYGYAKVKFRNQGKFKNHSVHMLVATVFIDNPENKPQVNHIDGNKLNNNVDNLEWVTGSENQRHAFDTGLNFKGEKHHNSKLTDKERLEIIELRKSGYTCTKIAEMYNVVFSTIAVICRNANKENKLGEY